MADKASKLEQLRLLALKCASNTAAKVLELANTMTAALEELDTNKADKTEATAEAAGLMPAADKNKLDKIPFCIKSTGTFDGLGWVSGSDGYSQTITVGGVTSDSVVVVVPAAAYKEAYENMNCKLIGQATNALTFKSNSPQDVAIEVNVIIYDFNASITNVADEGA